MDPDLMDPDTEFANAFNEEEGERAGDGESINEEVAEDAAGDAGQSGGGAPADTGVAVVLNNDQAADGQATEGQGQGAVDLEKEMQRLKSWEGRLKAREAELESKASKAGGEERNEHAADALEDVAATADARGSSELADAANAAAEAVEAGEITPEQAVAQLSEDFGEEFIKMIQAIVVATTKKEVEPVTKTVDEVLSNINSKEERAHFKAIASKHPDFADVGGSESFKAYILALPEDKRGDAERVAKGGSAEEVIALLDAYKGNQAKPKDDPKPAAADTSGAEDSGLADLEGVRSGGVRLPEKPTPGSDDYAGAWDEF